MTVTENTENEDDGRRGDGGVDARVLGRLLHAMPFLEMLPSAERIAEFLTAALADVPGVKSCAVHLGESAAQDGRPGRRSDPAAGATLSRGRWTVPVETGGQIYGDFVLEVDDEPSLNPYLPYLTNLAGSVALITENRLRRDRLAAALAEVRVSAAANARLAAAVDSSDDAILTKTLEGRIVTWNAGAERMYGYAADEIIGQSVSRLMPPGSEDELAELLASVGRGDGVQRHDAARLRRDGSALHVSLSVSPLRDDAGVIVGASVIAHDVTEERRVEVALAESARRHHAILQTALDGFWLGDAQGRLIEVNEAYCRMSGFRSEELQGMRISDLESAETAAETKSHLATLIAAGEDRFETRHRRKNGSVFDVAISVQYHPGEGGHFVAFLQDISERKAAESELARNALELRERVFDTVMAMGALVGVRDPYTAAHELRVTSLVTAVAEELGLDDARREGLALASQVHDIGKIAVPAEILSKPGALNDIELALVRQHSEIGREILSAIDFGQPVATIVAQHHERLDGSGYPDGLHADEIMLEARILAVADVVEAMASHRPYRAALPLEEALAEIEAGSGTRYDGDVCAATLRLFRDRRFAFTE